jgi:hypothetical protein
VNLGGSRERGGASATENESAMLEAKNQICRLPGWLKKIREDCMTHQCTLGQHKVGFSS